MRVRIETKQKSITSLSDVDFQIGEKTPGIKQTMCGIFLEGAFYFFLSFFLFNRKFLTQTKRPGESVEKIRTSHVAIPMES